MNLSHAKTQRRKVTKKNKGDFDVLYPDSAMPDFRLLDFGLFCIGGGVGECEDICLLIPSSPHPLIPLLCASAPLREITQKPHLHPAKYKNLANAPPQKPATSY